MSGEQAMNPEQAADFAALAAAANDAPAAPGAAVEQAAPEPMAAPLNEEIAGLLQALSAVAAPMFPSLADIYTPQQCASIGAALAPVCHKHGWLQDGVGGKWGEEIMALAVVGPVAFQTYAAIRHDIDAKQAQQGQKSGAGGVLPAPAGESLPDSGKTVTVGTVVPA